MYGYGGVGAGPQLGGVSGQPLEDLAALQRSTLANLPQLVGSGASQQTSKGVRTGIHYRHAKPRYSLSLAFLVVFFPFVGFLEILFRAKMLRLGWPGMFGNYLQLYKVTLFVRC